MEKEKYDASQKQDAPTSPPPSGSDQGHTPASELKQAKKASSGLKRPRTAYILFSMEFRKTLDTGIKFNEGTKLVSCLSVEKENKRKRKSLCREAFQPCLMADGRPWDRLKASWPCLSIPVAILLVSLYIKPVYSLCQE